MATDEDLLLEAIARITDGQPVDWLALESAAAASESLRARVAELKVVAGVADLARTPDGHATQATGDWAGRAAITWGHLKILEKVGEGAFGEVFRAWDSRLDREVALKLLKHRAGDPDGLPSSVIDEGRLLARVRHPNVATVYGADRVGSRVGIWMEFVHGRSLHQIIDQQGPLSPHDVAAIALDLARALRAVHDVGLLHRDIKAHNVLREPGGRVVLADFGTGAEHADIDASVQGALAGTPLYLAPELLDGEPPSVHTDIYALGVLLFYLASGAFPIRGRTLADVRSAHARRERASLAALRPDLPADLTAVIERAIDADPARRFPGAGALEAALHDFAESRRTPAPTARSRTRTLVAGVVIVAAVGALALWDEWFRSPESSAMAIRLLWESPEGWGPTTHDGSRMACVDPASLNIALCNLTTGAIHAVSRDAARGGRRELGARIAQPHSAVSPDGSRIAFSWRVREPGQPDSQESFELRVISVRDASSRILHAGGGQDGIATINAQSWNAEGSRFAAALQFAHDRSWAIAVVDPETGAREIVVESPYGVPQLVRWSSDGRFLTFTAPASAGAALRDLFIHDLVTGETRPLVDDPSDDFGAVWSPSGNEVVFVSDRLGLPAFWRMRVANGRPASDPTQISVELGRLDLVRPMSIAPGGSLYYWAETGGPQVFVASIDLGAGTVGPARRVSPQPLAYSAAPAWSPNGRFLAYAADIPTSRRLTSTNVVVVQDVERGTVQECPIATQIHQTSVGWSTDGEAVVVSGNRGREAPFLLRINPTTCDATRMPPAAGRPRPRYTKPLALWVQADDGTIAASADNGDGSFTQLLFPASGGDPRELAVTARCLAQAWSRDRRWVLLTCADPPDNRNSSLYSLSADGGPPRRLGLTLDQIRQVRVHPDGRQIAFSAGVPRMNVYALDQALRRR